MAIFKDAKLRTDYEHYTHLKDALAASKSDEAKKAARELQKSLASISEGKKLLIKLLKSPAVLN